MIIKMIGFWFGLNTMDDDMSFHNNYRLFNFSHREIKLF